jgi:ribosomal protein L37AE/L43A
MKQSLHTKGGLPSLMAGFGGLRKGRNEAVDNLGYNEEGDCPRCGGNAQDSTMKGYLQCGSCSHEWADPNYVEEKQAIEPPSYKRDEELIRQFRKDMQSGELADVLGVKEELTGEQEQSLKRLEDKWMSGMQGHFNAAAEERKPLMISFDDDDNIVSTEVGSITLVDNGFDGGEEIRLEYPGIGTEFYAYNERSPTGWKRGHNAEATARSIANVINRFTLIFLETASDLNCETILSSEHLLSSLLMTLEAQTLSQKRAEWSWMLETL